MSQQSKVPATQVRRAIRTLIDEGRIVRSDVADAVPSQAIAEWLDVRQRTARNAVNRDDGIKRIDGINPETGRPTEGYYIPEDLDARYARSPVTGRYYRVTEWVSFGDGSIQAREKEEVEADDVPERWKFLIANNGEQL